MSTPLIAPRTGHAPVAADPADDLRLLLSDLQFLVERHGLKEQSRGLAESLKAAHDRLSGPRSVALLVGERTDLKRRFLERLLGPVPELPECNDVAWRLEYGREPECVVPMPEGLTAVLPLHQVSDFLARRGADLPAGSPRLTRLPSPALERGLAVLDTPALSQVARESLSVLLKEADTALLIVGPECTVQPATEEWLRTLPDRGARLEIWIEEGGALTSAAAAVARESLIRKLKDAGLHETKVLRVARDPSAATQADTSIAELPASLLERGRHRWHAQVRDALGTALDDAEATAQLEIKLAGLGLRQARLRRALRDIEALRLRFADLRNEENASANGATTSERAAPLPPVFEGTAIAAPPIFVRYSGDDASSAAPVKAGWREEIRRLTHMKVRVRRPEREHASASHDEATAGLNIFRRPGGSAPSRAPSRTEDGSDPSLMRRSWLLRGLGGALTAAFVCLLLWVFWPHSNVGPEDGAQWNYQPPAPTVPAPEAAAPPVEEPQPLDVPPVEAETQPPTRSSELGTRTLLHPRAADRTPLAKPIPDGRTAGVSRNHRHRDFLGIGKLWHWVRRSRDHKSADE